MWEARDAASETGLEIARELMAARTCRRAAARRRPHSGGRRRYRDERPGAGGVAHSHASHGDGDGRRKALDVTATAARRRPRRVSCSVRTTPCACSSRSMTASVLSSWKAPTLPRSPSRWPRWSTALCCCWTRCCVPVDPGAAPATKAQRRRRCCGSPTTPTLAACCRPWPVERRSMRLPPLPAWGVSHGCVLAPVVAATRPCGYLAILESDAATLRSSVSAEAELLAAQHAASVYALALMRERLAAEVTTELRDELLEGLLVGNVTDEQATRERARRLGYDETLAYQASSRAEEDASRARPCSPAMAPGPLVGAAVCSIAFAQLVRDRAPQAPSSAAAPTSSLCCCRRGSSRRRRTSDAPSRCTSLRCTRSGLYRRHRRHLPFAA